MACVNEGQPFCKGAKVFVHVNSQAAQQNTIYLQPTHIAKMSDIEPSKMKVTELRDELKKHGLDTKGKKEQLVKRLEKFLAGEAATQAGE